MEVLIYQFHHILLKYVLFNFYSLLLINMQTNLYFQILPILLQLLCPEQTYVLQSLNIFCKLLESKTNILEDYLQSFVPKLLLLSQNSTLMSIRITALQCLYHCCDFSLIKLLPLKKQVKSLFFSSNGLSQKLMTFKNFIIWN